MLASLLSLLFLAALPAKQVELPSNDGWVTDLAGMLTPEEERALENLMESYRVGTTHEIALLTIESLAGRSLEGYALEVARGWGIGGEDAHNGALMLVARDDRKLRIEVGRGLEGTLTDSIAGRIIRDIVTPAFKRGDFHGGMRGGIEAMHAAIGGDYGPLERTRAARRDSGGRLVVSGFFSFLVLLAILATIGGRGGGRRGRRGIGGGSFGHLFMLAMLGQHQRGSRGLGRGGRSSGGFGGFGSSGGGGFGGFGGGGGFSGGGASGGW